MTNEQANILIDNSVNKALPLSNGGIVYSRVGGKGLHLFYSLSDENIGKTKTIIPDFPNHRVGSWTVSDDVLYFLNPQVPSELLALNMTTNKQRTLLQGLDVGVGNSIAISPDETFAVISQRGISQSNLFITTNDK